MRTYKPTEDKNDRLPQAMVEGSTEFDWAELPDYLQDVIRGAAKELKAWAAEQEDPIVGEVVNEARSITNG